MRRLHISRVCCVVLSSRRIGLDWYILVLSLLFLLFTFPCHSFFQILQLFLFDYTIYSLLRSWLHLFIVYFSTFLIIIVFDGRIDGRIDDSYWICDDSDQNQDAKPCIPTVCMPSYDDGNANNVP